jgi:site-specific recombinase XerD
MIEPLFLDMEGDYVRYLLDVRGLSENSLRDYIAPYRRFGRYLAEKRVRAARRVTLGHVYGYLEHATKRLRPSSVRSYHTYLRSILRFLHFKRVLPTDLSKKMIVPRTWRLADVPRAFSEKEIEQAISHLRTETAIDLRERAIMTLFICYGLRLGEVTRLTLDAINWRRRTITVCERKNRVPLVLPLLESVVAALKDLIMRGRPTDAGSRRLFLNTKARGHPPLREQGVNEIVKKFLARCGLKGSARTFRHTLATHLINRGASLNLIQAILGQERSESARIYSKVHWEALREVAENDSLDI